MSQGQLRLKYTLEQELLHVKAYLEITEARFIDRLTILYDVDDHLLYEKIPPFTLQPIVENAIHHGINDMENNSVVKMTVRDLGTEIEIMVEDNGKGILPERLADFGHNAARV